MKSGRVPSVLCGDPESLLKTTVFEYEHAKGHEIILRTFFPGLRYIRRAAWQISCSAVHLPHTDRPVSAGSEGVRVFPRDARPPGDRASPRVFLLYTAQEETDTAQEG